MTAPRSIAAVVLLLAVSACGPDDAPSPTAADPATVTQGLGATFSTTIAGAVGGVAFQGDAKVGMFPPSTLQLRVKGVDVADGSLLDVSLAGYPVGTIRIARGEGAATLPVGFQVGLNSALALRLGGATVASATWH